jgi:hypothetical protein
MQYLVKVLQRLVKLLQRLVKLLQYLVKFVQYLVKFVQYLGGFHLALLWLLEHGSAKINFIVYPVTFRGFYPKIGVIFGKMFRGFLYSWKHFTLREYVRDLPTIGLHRCPKIISLISPISCEVSVKSLVVYPMYRRTFRGNVGDVLVPCGGLIGRPERTSQTMEYSGQGSAHQTPQIAESAASTKRARPFC